MAQNFQFKIKSSIFDRDRILIIHPDFIEFDDKDLLTGSPTRFDKSQIVAWRHGVKGIKGYYFNIGRVYCIDIKNSSDEIIKIRLKSIYRVRKKLLYKKYLTIGNLLWGNYFNDIVKEYINKFANKIEFTLLGTTITQEGIRFPKDTEIISWFDLSTKSYWHYYSLFSISNPDKYKPYYFLDDWNASVLLTIIKYILKEMKLR